MANFIDIQGVAAGRGGFLIGVSPDNIEYLSSSFSDRLQKTSLNLHLCSGAVVQVQEPEAIERILEELGLSQAEWQLNLENLELLND